MPQPNGFTFNDDITINPPDTPTGNGGNPDEIVITDPELIRRIETQCIRHERRDGKDALIIGINEFQHALFPDETEEDPTDDDDAHWDDDMYDDDVDPSILWAGTDWENADDLAARSGLIMNVITEGMWDLPECFLPASGDDCDYTTAEICASIGLMFGAERAARTRATVFLACGHYHVRNFHPRKDLAKWEKRIAELAVCSENWSDVLEDFPSIPRFEEAFARMNATGMNQLVATDMPGIGVRLRPVDQNGGFQPEIVALDDDEEDDTD